MWISVQDLRYNEVPLNENLLITRWISFRIILLDRYGDSAMQQRLCLNGDEELYSIKDSSVRTLNLCTSNLLANCFFLRMYTRLRKPCPEMLDWHKINRIVS